LPIVVYVPCIGIGFFQVFHLFKKIANMFKKAASCFQPFNDVLIATANPLCIIRVYIVLSKVAVKLPCSPAKVHATSYLIKCFHGYLNISKNYKTFYVLKSSIMHRISSIVFAFDSLNLSMLLFLIPFVKLCAWNIMFFSCTPCFFASPR